MPNNYSTPRLPLRSVICGLITFGMFGVLQQPLRAQAVSPSSGSHGERNEEARRTAAPTAASPVGLALPRPAALVALVPQDVEWQDWQHGDPGPQGPPGPAGPVGPTGAVGPAGPTGSVGPIGSQGPTGPQGGPGLTGAAGPTGPQGIPGVAGAMGPQGLTGPAGKDGALGATGSQGSTGPQGSAGPTGLQGLAGVDGATGPAGADGATGPTGVTGPAGPAGTTGQSASTLVSQDHGLVGLGVGTINVPGLWASINVPSDSVAVFSSDGGIVNTGVNGDFVQVDIYLVVDGVVLERSQVAIENGVFSRSGRWSFSIVATLSAGMHIVHVDAILSDSNTGNSSPYAFVGGTPDAGTRGTLTAIVLKQ